MASKIIVIEDSSDDSLLLELALEDGGVEATCVRVETLHQLEAALDCGDCEIVISDYSLPSLDVARALETIRVRGLDVPLIVVSGRYGEEKAVETMRAGAADYVPKDRLVRLAPAVTRELREAQHRRQARELQHYLGVSDPMRLFGRLASSLAHELSGPLTFLNAGLGVLSERLADAASGKPPTDDHMSGLLPLVERLMGVSDQITRTTSNFRALGGADDEPLQHIVLNDLVEHCVKLVQHGFRAPLQFVCELKEPVSCQLKVGRLSQGLVNVLVHVLQATVAQNTPKRGESIIVGLHSLPDCRARIDLRIPPGACLTTAPATGSAGPRADDYGLFMGRRMIEMIGGSVTTEQSLVTIDVPCMPT